LFENRLKKMLEEGKVPIGISISQIVSDHLGMLLSSAGFDFVLIDTEHSCFTTETVSNLASQSLGCNLTPLVRIPDDDLRSISQCLDSGLQGIMIPMAETVDQVKRVVERIKYAPIGKRGISLPNPNTRFNKYPFNDVIETSNNQTMLILQIETEKAVNNMNQLALIEGVDMLEIGPWDLSFSLGIPGQLDHPKFLKAVEKMIEICRKNNRWSSIYTDSLDVAKRYIKMGINALYYSSDVSLLTSKLAQDLSILKKL